MRKCADMPYHSGIELRIYPSRKQKEIIAINDGCTRAAYNRLVALEQERYQLQEAAAFVPAFQERIDYIDSILKPRGHGVPLGLKNAMPFMFEDTVDSMAIENAVKNHRAAWKKFREDPHVGVPTFHRKGYEQSYQTNAHYKEGNSINDCNARFLDMNHMTLPILGRIRIKGSKKRLADIINRTDTRIGTITVRRDAIGRYFVSLQLSSENPFVCQMPKTGAVVGIDLNLDNFLWDSNDHVVENPKYRRNIQPKMAKLQRSLSRKAVQAKKDKKPLRRCKNYQKNRVKLAKLHLKTAARAEDFLHIISKGYVKNHDYIFAEDLKVKNLLKNHSLAFAISECSWSDFLSKLDCKANMYGKTFLKVAPHYTTQTCSVCGHVLSGDDKLMLGDREWVCPNCNTYHVRDYNAAKNIMAKGLASLGLTAS